MKTYNIAIVGAGFSGAVLAHQLSQLGHYVTIFESRSHIAGNCHSERDKHTGIMKHVYGPHIFHTDKVEIWDFVNRFGEMIPFVNRVKAITGHRVYSLPINLLTINQFFDKTLSPREARSFIASLSDTSIEHPKSLEEQAIRFVGQDLYDAFFKTYTWKQWGKHPNELPAAILKRLPIRFNYDDNYFNHRYQGIPKNGYSDLVGRMLDQPRISILLHTRFESSFKAEFDHVFCTGSLDDWFDYCLGRLPYRTLDFELFYDTGDYQGAAVINYCDDTVPYTRITEHKHFSPWESHDKTVCYREYSRDHTDRDIPYYPIRLVNEIELLRKYVEMATHEKGVTFLGRLGTYRYLDMDVTIKEALDTAEYFNHSIVVKEKMPVFMINPLS